AGARRADRGPRPVRPPPAAGGGRRPAQAGPLRAAGVARPDRGGARLRPRGRPRRRPAGSPRPPRRPDPRPGHRGGAAAGAGPARTVRETPAMNLPAALYAIRWLVRDTFRQSLASRIFWVMLAVSALCVFVCLSVGVQGDVSLQRPDEPPEFVPKTDPK